MGWKRMSSKGSVCGPEWLAENVGWQSRVSNSECCPSGGPTTCEASIGYTVDWGYENGGREGGRVEYKQTQGSQIAYMRRGYER